MMKREGIDVKGERCIGDIDEILGVKEIDRRKYEESTCSRSLGKKCLVLNDHYYSAAKINTEGYLRGNDKCC